jgi:hypothetical protein
MSNEQVREVMAALEARTAAAKEALAGEVAPELLPSELAEVTRRLASACGGCKKRVAECGTDAECGAASMALTYCTAQVVCPPPFAAAFGASLAKGDGASEAELEAGFSAMAGCIEAFDATARKTVAEQAKRRQANAEK